MHACKLHITCDDFVPGQIHWYYEGQLIRGTVHVQVTRRMVATLRIQQLLHRLDDGYQVTQTIVLAKGTWEHGHYRFPFTCTTDDGPPTVHDRWWSLAVMMVDVRTDFLDMIKRAFDPNPSAWMGYVKLMPGAPPPQPQVEQSESDSKMEKSIIKVFGFIYGFILLLGGAYFGIRELESMNSPLLRPVAIWAMVGLTLSGLWGLVVVYFKFRRRGRRRSSSDGAPLTLPRPTFATPPERQDNPQPTEGRSDATDQ